VQNPVQSKQVAGHANKSVEVLARLAADRRRRAEKARLNAIAAAEIEEAKFARLPWPVRAIGRVFDLFYKVTGL
jgi:hypothetical protein